MVYAGNFGANGDVLLFKKGGSLGGKTGPLLSDMVHENRSTREYVKDTEIPI